MLREPSEKSLRGFYPLLPYRCGGAGALRPLCGKQEVDDVRVLVVEDESYLADAIALGLRRETMAVDVAGNGPQ